MKLWNRIVSFFTDLNAQLADSAVDFRPAQPSEAAPAQTSSGKEPMCVFTGEDPLSPTVIYAWCALGMKDGVGAAKLAGAREIAGNMERGEKSEKFTLRGQDINSEQVMNVYINLLKARGIPADDPALTSAAATRDAMAAWPTKKIPD